MRVVDTSVAIDHLRDFEPAKRLLDQLLADRVPLVSSEAVRFELLAGMRPRDERRVEAFLTALDWLAVNEAVARRAAQFARQYRPGHSGIGDVDYLIAATASLLDVPLLTTNVRDFPMFPGLQRPY